MSNTNNVLILLARILLSFMFIFAGFGKVTDPAATAGMIAGAGLPAATALTYLAGTFELVMGLSVLVGYQVRYTGWLIAAFCVFTGIVFHLPTVNVPDFPAAANGWINGLNFVNFLKNITLAGAYIMLATNGAGVALTFGSTDFGFTDPSDSPADTFTSVKFSNLNLHGGQLLDVLEAAGALRVEGDRALAERVVTLFPLPPKIEPTG